MQNLHKSNEIKLISLAKIRASSVKDCKELILAIGEVVGKNLASSCIITSISHTYEVKAIITEKRSTVRIDLKEKPGNTLQFRDDSKELSGFSYDLLKKLGNKENGQYKGILYGTIELHKCEKEIDCPNCGGTGICSTCNGEKQITCPVCEGETKCIQCSGSGKYTCRHCDGSGECPECDDGWCVCGYCNGEGKVSCPDCCGTGNYIDEPCNKCGGSGYYGWNKKCRACDGTGRFVKECRKCEGEGNIKCDNCDGKGGWTCKGCHGTGNCSHCNGRGWLSCKACEGTGICGKCKGKGAIWCPDCHGKGICFECKGNKKVECPRCDGLGEYQTFAEYSIDEDRIYETELCSLPVEKTDISSIKGDICYNDVVYDFFAKKTNIYNIDSLVRSLQGTSVNIIKKWFSLDNYPSFKKDMVDDYMNISAKVYKIPVSIINLRCNSKDYCVYVVGKDLTVYYQDLPSFGAVLVGRIRNLIKK